MSQNEQNPILAPCPGGHHHQPAMQEFDDLFWVECSTCKRESYAVDTHARAVESWAGDVGLPGRSKLVHSLKQKMAKVVKTCLGCGARVAHGQQLTCGH